VTTSHQAHQAYAKLAFDTRYRRTLARTVVRQSAITCECFEARWIMRACCNSTSSSNSRNISSIGSSSSISVLADDAAVAAAVLLYLIALYSNVVKVQAVLESASQIV
jgi:hypothetical protein